MELLDIIFTTNFFFSVIRVTTPIMFATMAAVVASTAGIPNIAIEGIMLTAAFAGMAVSALTTSAGVGLIAALIISMLTTAILAYFTLYYRTNIILGGIALNSLASGGTVFALYLLTGDKGTSASIKSMTLPTIDIPLIQDIPVLGDIISGHNILTYVAIIAVIVVYIMIKKTPFGFHLRAVGKDENAAKSVGINVTKVKFKALVISGLLAGFGGAFMSMGYVSMFTRDMVAGRGWIALAAEAMGQGTPIGSAVTALLFGVADAFSNSVGILGWPSDLVRTIPYCITIIGLFIFSVRIYRRKNKYSGNNMI